MFDGEDGVLPATSPRMFTQFDLAFSSFQGSVPCYNRSGCGLRRR
jgi:hypothetical protein